MAGFKAPIVALSTVLPFFCLGMFGQHEFAIFFIAALCGAIMLALTWSLEHLLVYLAVLIMGIITEILSVHVGVWSYPTERALGFPLWIPVIWANGALFIIEFKEWVDQKLARKRERRA